MRNLLGFVILILLAMSLMGGCTELTGVGSIRAGLIYDRVLSIDPHVDGYTSIWLTEDEEANVYCLLASDFNEMFKTIAEAMSEQKFIWLQYRTADVGSEGGPGIIGNARCARVPTGGNRYIITAVHTALTADEISRIIKSARD